MRPRTTKTAALLFGLATVSGCALMPKSANGPVFTKADIPPGKAAVFFYRPARISMSANTIFMSIPHEANVSCPMVTAGYYPYVTDPGRVHISVAKRLDLPNLIHFYIDLKAGDEKFVKVDYGAWAPTEELSEVPAEVALPEIRTYRLIGKCE